jgi:APA family basic amino acid/polyamine antiporter
MWFLNASSLGSTVAYVMVAIALLVLKKKEPGLTRPYSMSGIVGYIALAISVGFLLLFLPISPAALKLPEWTIVFIWAIVGMLLAAAAKPTMAGVSWAERERLIFGGKLARRSPNWPGRS